MKAIIIYLIKLLFNSLIYILKYIWLGILLSLIFILYVGIVIPITIIFSTLKFMWKFNTTALYDGCEYIIELYYELCDIYLNNKPNFKIWK